MPGEDDPFGSLPAMPAALAANPFYEFQFWSACTPLLKAAKFLCVGEQHDAPLCRMVLINNVAKLQAAGVTHLGLEAPDTFPQEHGEQLVAALDFLKRAEGGPGLGDLYTAAVQGGLKVCLYDYAPPTMLDRKHAWTAQVNARYTAVAKAYLPNLGPKLGPLLTTNPVAFNRNPWVRVNLMNRYAADALKKAAPTKCVVLVGADHVTGKPGFEPLQVLLGAEAVAVNASKATVQVVHLVPRS